MGHCILNGSLYPEWITEMKRLSIDPEIKGAHCGYLDLVDYDYPTQTFSAQIELQLVFFVDTLVGGQGCPCNLKGLENERPGV